MLQLILKNFMVALNNGILKRKAILKKYFVYLKIFLELNLD